MVAVAALCLLSVSPSVAQSISQQDTTSVVSDSELAAARSDARHSIPFPLSLVVPTGISNGYALRDYIASDVFGRFSRSSPPEDVLDEIYITAAEYNHGELDETLLTSAYGTFEHEFIPIAFFGSELRIPLTTESHSRFMTRQENLPEHIYHTAENDRDKLQHFFSSSWLKSVLGMDWLVNLAGEGVETFESLFVIGSSRDERDIHANHDGVRFAIHASEHIAFPPSKALTPNP